MLCGRMKKTVPTIEKKFKIEFRGKELRLSACSLINPA